MKYIGVGNCGCLLAFLMDKESYLFSTAIQDTSNFPEARNIFVMSEDGASKRFKQGQSLWEENKERVKGILNTLKGENVVVFSSGGGGSGSSSLSYMASILTELDCKVLIVLILPFKNENNPPLANSVQAVNSLIPYLNKISVMLFDNNTLIKKYSNNWVNINNHIISKVDMIVNLIDKYSVKSYSPITLDKSELESVVYAGGFLDCSINYTLEENSNPFEYGIVDSKTKNYLVALIVNEEVKREVVNSYHTEFTAIIEKDSRKVANSRIIPGIIRGNKNIFNYDEKVYIVIASGLSTDFYLKKIDKMRTEAVKKATIYAESNKTEKLISGRDTKVLDI